MRKSPWLGILADGRAERLAGAGRRRHAPDASGRDAKHAMARPRGGVHGGGGVPCGGVHCGAVHGSGVPTEGTPDRPSPARPHC